MKAMVNCSIDVVPTEVCIGTRSASNFGSYPV